MARPPSTQPTDGELEILNVLWDVGPAALGQIREILNANRPVATTTVATMLKTMQGKGLVRRESGPKGFEYSAVVSREAAASGLLKKLLGHMFDGSARRLVAHLLSDGSLDARERREVLDLLDKAASERPKQPKKGGRK